MTDNSNTEKLLASREEVYGNRVNNMQRVAQMWNGYLGVDVITAADVAMMFVLYKAYRFKITPDYSDNINDVFGYAEMAREVQRELGGLIDAETVKEYLRKKNYGDDRVGEIVGAWAEIQKPERQAEEEAMEAAFQKEISESIGREGK